MSHVTRPTPNSSSTNLKFVDWCKRFIQEYNDHFKDESLSQQQIDNFRDNFLRFLKTYDDDLRLYKVMISKLVKGSTQDKGELSYNFIKAFLDLLVRFKCNNQHQVNLLKNVLLIFECAELEPVVAFDFEVLYKKEIQRLSPENVENVFLGSMDLFNNEEITKKCSIKLLLWLTTLHDKTLSNKTVLQKLFTECKQSAIDGIVNVICDDDQKSIFIEFADQFLGNAFGGDILYQKLGFAKITSCLRTFNEAEIEVIIKCFCDGWSDKDSFFLHEIANEIAEFTKVLHRHPIVGKSVVKFFKKDKKLSFSSIFGLICQIGLISSYRFEDEVSKMLSSSLSKIWQFSNDLENDGWVYTIIKDLQLRNIKCKLDEIINFISDCPNAAEELVKGLTVLSLRLMQPASKKVSITIIDGKLDRVENDISFIGRRLLVNTISAVSLEIDKKYTIEPLEALVTEICINATKIPHVYYLIDVLIELRNKDATKLVMLWDTFEKLTKNICQFPSEVAVKIMSSLMPVIIKRDGLRSEIFKSLKTEMVSVSKVVTALPIMFQLLRSMVEQPETKYAFQCSQSFATFSSQISVADKSVLDVITVIECIKRCLHQSPTSQLLVFKEIVAICKKNSYFVIHGLDMLVNELIKLPPLKNETYVGKRLNGESYIKYQCPQLLQAVNEILTAASASYIKSNYLNQSQLSQNGKDIVASCSKTIDDYIRVIVDINLKDLELDDMSFKIPYSESFKFGLMMVQLFDAAIECLWNFRSSQNNDKISASIEQLIMKRTTLSDLIEGTGKPKIDSTTNVTIKPKGKIVKVSKAKGGKIIKPPKSKGIPIKSKVTIKNVVSERLLKLCKFTIQDMHIEISKLSSMLDDLNLPFSEKLSSNGDISLKDTFLPWLLFQIHKSVNLLNPHSSTCITSLKSLTNMASSLLHFFSSKEPSSLTSSDVAIKANVIAKTKAVESYCKILVYIITKYRLKCGSALKEIYDNVMRLEYAENSQHQHGTAISQIETDDIDAYDADFRKFSVKHIAIYYQKIITGIVACYETFVIRKCTTEYHKQISSFLMIAQKLTSLFKASSNDIRVKVFQLILPIAQNYKFGDKKCAIDFWNVLFEIVTHSNIDEYWVTTFNTFVKALIGVIEEQTNEYPSLEEDVAPQVFVLVTRAISFLLAKIQTVINIKLEVGDEIDDSLLTDLCCTVEKFGTNILAIVKIQSSVLTDNAQMESATVEMLIDFYSTLNCIAKQLKTKVVKKIDIAEWESLNHFNRLIFNLTDDILKESANKFGNGNYVEQNVSKAKKTRGNTDEMEILNFLKRNRRDEKLFVRMDKEFENFHGSLIIIEGKYGNKNRPLTLQSISDKGMRVFALDTNALAEKFGTNPYSDGSDADELEDLERNDQFDNEDSE